MFASYIPTPSLPSLPRTPWPSTPRLSYEPTSSPHADVFVNPVVGEVLTTVYDAVSPLLANVLTARASDRALIDTWTSAAAAENIAAGRDVASPDYLSVVGMADGDRVLVGPNSDSWREPQTGSPVAPLPPHLQGFHVTLFGPPDSAKLAVNAMNASSRTLPNEPDLVAQLVAEAQIVPKWGADDEDSKTPLFADLAAASHHLNLAFDGVLTTTDQKSGKVYALEDPRPEQGVFPSTPIKRIPGLDLPAVFASIDNDLVPLHMLDFVAHVVANVNNPAALSFYIPKLENEEEAAYLAALIAATENAIRDLGIAPQYVTGTIRVILVLENPRAVFRLNAMMDVLFPYFAGASLGWHDYLASTARLFARDPNYRIPVKADPDIVISHIKESHILVAELVGARGGLKIGGMYGILPSSRQLDDPSMQVTLVGYFRDVVTQLKRGLDGFWVAHPDFVRIGIAIVHAWKTGRIDDLIDALILTPEMVSPLKAFIHGQDVPGLDSEDPVYPRALLAATVGSSNVISNSDESEVRYNVFQALQYLADWLVGNGCVALPTTVSGVAVRVMDDLATTERSRFEVWAEVFHNRVSIQDLLRIVHEELNFIRRDRVAGTKAVQVKWTHGVSDKWYPVAANLFLLLTLPSPTGVIQEWAPRLLLPFTLPFIRDAEDPWESASQFDPAKYQLPHYVSQWRALFTGIAHPAFASEFANKVFLRPEPMASFCSSMDIEDIRYAADFHGDIGQAQALFGSESQEQAALMATGGAASSDSGVDLYQATLEYQAKFGFKFLASAQGVSAPDMMALIQTRMNNDLETEIANARDALVSIAIKRYTEESLLTEDPGTWFSSLLESESVSRGTLALCRLPGSCPEVPTTSTGVGEPSSSVKSIMEARADLEWTAPTPLVTDAVCVVDGEVVDPVTSLWQIASMSKTFGAALVLEYFINGGSRVLPNVHTPQDGSAPVSLKTSVNALLRAAGSEVVLVLGPESNAQDPDAVTLTHLVDHTGLDMPYVFGLPTFEVASGNPAGLIRGDVPEAGANGYVPIVVNKEPGKAFGYSGGAFIVIQHLLELYSGVPIAQLMRVWLSDLGLDPETQIVFDDPTSALAPESRVGGVNDAGEPVPLLHFPPLAAGAWSTPSAVLAFLGKISSAYATPGARYPLSHDTAVRMVGAPQDRGALKFQNARVGRGLFVASAGLNKMMIHQASNDGYTGIYGLVFAGPDAGSGWCAVTSGDLKGCFANVAISRAALKALRVSGVDASKYGNRAEFDPSAHRPEQVVNQAYRTLLFSGFETVVPQILPVPEGTPEHPYVALDVAAGAELVSVTDQAFAAATNLVRRVDPVFDPSAFGPEGKVMDSWETGRHRNFVSDNGYDVATYALAQASCVAAILVSTVWHDGNHANAVAIEARLAESDGNEWVTLLPPSPLDGHSDHTFVLPAPSAVVDAFRVHNIPDGGISRVRLLSSVPDGLVPGVSRHGAPIPRVVPTAHALAAWLRASGGTGRGGTVVEASNEHYGPASAVVSAYPPQGMFDGMESARSRGENHADFVVIELDNPGPISSITLDFAYFRNNNPYQVSILGRTGPEEEWIGLVEGLETKEYAGNILVLYADLCASSGWGEALTHVKVMSMPDGGINRITVLQGVSKL